jgi:hypothetical protein
LMRKRVFIATVAAAALLVAPVAGTHAKQDGDGGSTKSKKCERLRHVGFKVKGTLEDASDLTTIDMTVSHANRHARDWLAENSATFVLEGDENIKLIGVTDKNGDATVDFEDALGVEFRVKLKGKLELLKHGCPEEDAVLEDDAVDVKKVKVKATETAETD